MDSAHLKVVAREDSLDVSETAATRIRRLQQEIRAAATEEVGELERAMETLTLRARTIVASGEAFPPGVREICRSLADELDAQARSICVIMGRSTH